MATLAHPASVASRIRQPALISLYQSAYRNTAPAALRARLFPTAMSAPCTSVPAAAAPLLAARRRCARACAVAPAPCQRGASFSGRVAPLALATPRRADSHSKRTHRPAAAALPVSAAASTVRRPPRMLGDAAVPPVACTATARALLLPLFASRGLLPGFPETLWFRFQNERQCILLHGLVAAIAACVSFVRRPRMLAAGRRDNDD